jgi:Ca-activated chloride channel family protein
VSFASPWWLVALLGVPLLVAAYVVHERMRRRSASAFGNPALFPNVIASSPGWRRHLPIAVLLLGLASMIVGVARPHATVHVPREEATVVVAIDVSKSMTATDVQPSRIVAAAHTVQSFLDTVPRKYRVALVAIGSRAVLAVPPTQDRSLVETAFKNLQPGEGTALGDSVALTARVVKAQRTSDGVVPPAALLVVSDGAQDGGQTSVDRAIALARQAHLPVYTVLLGTANGTVEETLTGGYKAIIQVPAQPQTLQKLAQSTGGKFYEAASASQLKDVYGRLGSRLGTKKTSREMTDVVAGGSAVLLLIGASLSARWFGRAV